MSDTKGIFVSHLETIMFKEKIELSKDLYSNFLEEKKC